MSKISSIPVKPIFDANSVVGFRLFDDLGYDLIVPSSSLSCHSEAAEHF